MSKTFTIKLLIHTHREWWYWICFKIQNNSLAFPTCAICCSQQGRYFEQRNAHNLKDEFKFLNCKMKLPLIFILHWWPLAFLILSPPPQNFHVVLPTKKCLLCFLSLALDLCRPFSRWASLACRLLSLFLCLSLALYSKFVDMTINLSLIL